MTDETSWWRDSLAFDIEKGSSGEHSYGSPQAEADCIREPGYHK